MCMYSVNKELQTNSFTFVQLKSKADLSILTYAVIYCTNCFFMIFYDILVSVKYVTNNMKFAMLFFCEWWMVYYFMV